MQGPGTLLERFPSSRLVCFSYFTYRKIRKKINLGVFVYTPLFWEGSKQEMYLKKDNHDRKLVCLLSSIQF